jgi:hypothetical protein
MGSGENSLTRDPKPPDTVLAHTALDAHCEVPKPRLIMVKHGTRSPELVVKSVREQNRVHRLSLSPGVIPSN